MLDRLSGWTSARSLTVILSTCLAFGLLFGMIFIQTRADLVVRRQQADFGATARVARQVRDAGDVVTERASAQGAAPQRTSEGPLERFRIEVAPVGDGSAAWCREATANEGRLRLSMEGLQARDRRLTVTALPPADSAGQCARTSAQAVLDPAPSDDGGPRDLAIEGPDGRTALVLRGSIDWPETPTSAAIVSDQNGKDGGKAALPVASAGGVIPVRVGGEERLLYQWPIDLGRTVTIVTGEGEIICPPRKCRLDALGDAPALGAVLDNFSPATKAIFSLGIILLLLLVPLIKLASIDLNAGLRWLDVIAIIASIPLTVATLVLCCAIVAGWTENRRDQDHLARAVAVDIARDIDGEVDASLRATEHRARRFGPPWGHGEDSLQFEPAPLPILIAQLRDRANSLPVDAANVTNHPPSQDVSDRRYFQRLRKGDLLPCVMPGDGQMSGKERCAKGRSYVVDQVPAANNGNSRMVLLIDDPGSPDRFVMAGKPLAAALQVPVPEGFGFAVVDPATGEVLHHSDATRAHNESFGEQLDVQGRLRQAMATLNERCDAASRHGDRVQPDPTFSARYGGRRVRMAFAPSCSARWLVAAWYDRAAMENGVLVPAYVAGTLMLVAAGLLAAGIAGAALASRQSMLRRLWPDPEPLAAPEAEEAFALTILPHIIIGLLMIGGLWLARGDALALHALLSILLLPITFATPRRDGSWGQFPLIVGKTALLAYLFLTLLAVTALALIPRSFSSFLGYLVVMLAAMAMALSGWHRHRWLRGAFLRLGRRTFVQSRLRASPAARWRRKLRGRPAWLGGWTGDAGRTHPLASISRRLRRVLRLQVIALLLVAVVPTLAAYRVSADVVRADRTVANMLALCEARVQAELIVNQLRNTLYRPPLWPWPMPGCDSGVVPGLGGPDIQTMLIAHYRQDQGAISHLIGPLVHIWYAQPPVALEAGNWRHAPPGSSLPIYSGTLIGWLGDILLVMAMAIVSVGATHRLLMMAACGLFGLQHFAFRALHPRHTPWQIRVKSSEPLKAVFIDYPYHHLRQMHDELQSRGQLEMFDLSIERSTLGDKSMSVLTAKSWIVTGFEAIIANRELRLRALSLLEQLTARKEVEVFFFAQTLPLVRLRQTREREKREADVAGAAGVMNESESYRWAELFSEFITYTWNETIAVPTTGARPGMNLVRLLRTVKSRQMRRSVLQWARCNPAAAAVIADEMIRIPSDRIQDQIRSFSLSPLDVKQGKTRALSDLSGLYVEQIYEYMANFLGDYYQGEWVRCAREEHLILYHLAHGKFINACNFAAINSLLSRRLITTDPDFRLMNRSFGHWIRTLQHPSSFTQFRREAEAGGTWNLLRLPLLLLVAGGSILVSYLDRDGAGSLITLIPGAVATMPILLSRFTRPAAASA